MALAQSKTLARSALLLLAALPLTFSACKGDDPQSESSTSASDDEVGTTTDTGDGEAGEAGEAGSAESSTGADADTTQGDSTAETEAETSLDTEGGAACGDGVIDEGEECDDGDDNGETFACLSDCTLNICGDGFEGPEEGCDDGNLESGDGCSATCLLEGLDPEAILCGNKVFACGDTIDNDDDGKIDLADPECISPCDDNEASFQTDLPGQNNDCKADCYFDDNSGGGDDKCEWNLKCDPENPGAQVGCEYDPDFGMCETQMPPECLDFCVPLVPNGCDCFGCCEIEGQFIYLDSSPDCSLDNLEGCEACTFFEDCNNPCIPEDCELCFGQDPDDLPEECDEPTCPEGQTSCGGQGDCALGEFCQAGCCFPIDPQ